jgi:hypothetical protein
MPPLGEELGLDPAKGRFCRFRTIGGAQYLFATDDLRWGLELQLAPYEHQVFLDFQLIDDIDGHWQRLHDRLQGAAVANLDREMLEMRYQPLWKLFNALLDPGRLQVLAGGLLGTPQAAPTAALIAQLTEELQLLATGLRTAVGKTAASPGDVVSLNSILKSLAEWLTLPPTAKPPGSLLREAWHGSRSQSGCGVPVLSWLLVHRLSELTGAADENGSLQLLKHFGLDFAWRENITSGEQERDVSLALTLLRTAGLAPHPACSEKAFAALCNEPANAGFLGINSHAGTTWFSREGMTALAGAVAIQGGVISLWPESADSSREIAASAIAEALRQRLARSAAVGFRLDKFLGLG